MRRVICSMGMSLDGYINDRDGGLDWSTPSAEVFRSSIEEIRTVDVHLMGRRLYETMRYWDTVDAAELGEDEREWQDLWVPLPKVVFSSTLTAVEGTARLAAGTVADEIARLRAEPGDGDIAIGGATLLAAAAADDLVDEYRVRVHPALLGGGMPLFAPGDRRQRLELVDRRTFDSGLVALRYAVIR